MFLYLSTLRVSMSPLKMREVLEYAMHELLAIPRSFQESPCEEQHCLKFKYVTSVRVKTAAASEFLAEVK